MHFKEIKAEVVGFFLGPQITGLFVPVHDVFFVWFVCVFLNLFTLWMPLLQSWSQTVPL